MEALYLGNDFVDPDPAESIANILGRYNDIGEAFPAELRGDALPYFVDWLIENVHLVEITAYSDEDAYTIFETMNDRGLSLTPADMLKGYLLANITDSQQRLHAGRIWKDRMSALFDLGKDEDADAIKSWLRSQHAETIRDRRRGAHLKTLISSERSFIAGCGTTKTTSASTRALTSFASSTATLPSIHTGMSAYA